MFAMLSNLSHLRAIGTWGGVANDSSPLATAWYDGLAAFLAAAKVKFTQLAQNLGQFQASNY